MAADHAWRIPPGARPGSGRSGTGAASQATLLALAQRYSLVLPLCRGRCVLDLSAANPHMAELRAVARRFAVSPAPASFEIVLSLDDAPLPDAAACAAMLAGALAAGGLLVLAAPTESADALHAVLGGFAHRAVFHHRPLAGVLIEPAELPPAEWIALRRAPDAPPATALWLAGDAPLPALAGLRETGLPGSIAPLRPEPASWPAAPPEAAVQASRVWQERAVGLVERLLALEDERLQRDLENAALRAARPSGAVPAGAPEPDRQEHGWPLAENPRRDPAGLGLYDRRPDDAAVLEALDGQDFLARFQLLARHAEFEGAVAALNAGPAPPPQSGPPDASIVIPVYGQLAYTLNCLHSLLRHASRFSVEIIVVDDCSPDASGAVLPGIAGIRYIRQPRNGGFIASCAAGAAAATGRFIILLNNDTRVVPGWLDAMLDSFALFPQAGLVGAKLLYPDGKLQEAGGIIWRDGSAWNYGRGDDPNRPGYCHARRADYISGAAIALPAALWHELGGFDRHFSPAYCEDSDLAFRVRAAGREVWYQPRARVIHYEGRTSGTDVTQGAKAYQVVNAKKLFVRWRDTLAAHRVSGELPLLERERAISRRVLVIDATTPTPDQDAGSVTSTLSMRLLAELGYKVLFVPEDNFLYQENYTGALQMHGIECAYAPYELGLESYLQRHAALIDAVLVFRVAVLERVLAPLRRHVPRAPVLFNVMDLHFLRLRRAAELSGDAAALEQAEAMRARELALIGQADCTITPSRHEFDLLRAELPQAPVMMWPFMFEHVGTSTGFAARRDFVFLGGYRHPPNVDAVQWFAREILPLIRREMPQARFIIAGAAPGPEVQALAGPGIVVTGLVPELRDVFDPARVFVCPLRYGAGVKGKLSAAMAHGLPVVTTAIGAEGMEMEAGTVLQAETPAAFAAACIRLHGDAALWQRLAQAGEDFVKTRQSLEVGRHALRQALDLAHAHLLGLPDAA